MAFRIKRKETAAEAMRRITREGVEHALEDLNQSDALQAIHAVRKQIKKLRAVLRLVRPALGGGSYRKASDDLREAAQYLSPVRDAHVRLKAVKALIDSFREELAPRPFAGIQNALRGRCEEERKRFKKAKAGKRAARRLESAGKRCAKLALRRKGWGAIGAGLERSYCRGQQAYKKARSQPTPENLHAWRKRVKDLWYQLRLLCRIWPEVLEVRAQELKTLSKYLGDGHDLELIKESLKASGDGDGQAKEVEVLYALTQRRQGQLQQKALALGARLYLEKPAHFIHRLRGYWEIWHKGKG